MSLKYTLPRGISVRDAGNKEPKLKGSFAADVPEKKREEVAVVMLSEPVGFDFIIKTILVIFVLIGIGIYLVKKGVKR